MSVLLSILDLAPVADDVNSVQALQNSIALARCAEELGYTRYWLAEHHNIPSIAISAPEIMIGIIARETKTIRVGSGGIMLPNHAPLKVAEAFRTLEALYPGRIDLGIGRAPGTDPSTALALRGSRKRLDIRDFPEQLSELMAFGRSDLVGSDFAADNPFRAIRTIPTGIALPPLWLLGSSREYSATLAAQNGLGFAFAYHINATLTDAVAAMQCYRQAYIPTASRPTPQALLAVSVICSDSPERAEELATVLDLAHVRRQRGELRPLPTVAEALAYPFSAVEAAQAERYRARLVVGDPTQVCEQLDALARETGVDELLITTAIADHSERCRSYLLLAQHTMNK